MKRLIIIISQLAMSYTTLRAQCWFSETQVKGVLDEDITIGHPDPNSGRTVCYKWSSDDGWLHIVGPTNGPTLNLHLPEYEGTFHYTVKKISDHIETCVVTVKVEEECEIVSITPKQECWNHGDALTEADFDIVTNPSGLESRVHLTSNSRTATNLVNTGNTRYRYQTLNFEARSNNGRLLDEATQIIKVYSTTASQDGGSVIYEQELPPRLIETLRKINGASELIDKVNFIGKKLAEGLNKIPNCPLEFQPMPITFHADVTGGFDVCCKGNEGEKQIGINVGGTVGASAAMYFPVRNLYPIYAPLISLPPQLALTGQVSLQIFAMGNLTFNTCSEISLDLPLSITLTAVGGISWGKHDEFIFGMLGVFGRISSEGSTLYIIPWQTPSIHGRILWGFTGKFQMNADWFKPSVTLEYIVQEISI